MVNINLLPLTLAAIAAVTNTMSRFPDADYNVFRIVNVAALSVLSYSTGNTEPKGPAIHTQIVGNRNASTTWRVAVVPNGHVRFHPRRQRVGHHGLACWRR
ncbi:hypothetical protein B0H10DRAFT_2440714 [Mycena sp. CBHHK59/15]|nr:hypothetical protein B0H10DRAFT_2440714 [Mycena sp. CBHHK59/15]